MMLDTTIALAVRVVPANYQIKYKVAFMIALIMCTLAFAPAKAIAKIPNVREYNKLLLLEKTFEDNIAGFRSQSAIPGNREFSQKFIEHTIWQIDNNKIDILELKMKIQSNSLSKDDGILLKILGDFRRKEILAEKQSPPEIIDRQFKILEKMIPLMLKRQALDGANPKKVLTPIEIAELKYLNHKISECQIQLEQK